MPSPPMLFGIAVAALLGGCGSPRPPDRAADRDGRDGLRTGSGHSKVVAPPRRPNPTPCPASYAGAGDQACENPVDEVTSCSYPEGTCSCTRPPPPCQGMAPDPMAPPPPTRWICAPPVDPDPPPRPDGCPGKPPRGACETDGKSCSYGACCVDIFTCTGGSWKQTGSECPP